MTKADLIDQIHGLKDLNNDVSKKNISTIVEGVFSKIQDALKADGRFSFPGFGTFTRKVRAAREGINPKTKEKIKIPETTTVTFKPASRFKDDLKGGAKKKGGAAKKSK
jgi:DNA-binding protein HU-beta